MLKILLYGNAEERKTIKEALTKQLEENNISFEFHGISDLDEYVKNYMFNSDYPLKVIRLDGHTKYTIEKAGSPTFGVLGSLSFPPTSEEIDKKFIRNDVLAGFFSL